ncbi:MAG: ribonuclease III, partial [Bacteroidia bacterium]|nr:ribonuclease III [Bacteroidia bacterium]
NKSAYGDAFEALIGASYIDRGYNVAQKFVLSRIVKHYIDIEEIEQQDKNFKSKLINWSQRERKVVEFELLEEVDNGGKKLLRVRVLVDGVEKARGEDFSKKRAEQIAAEKVCLALQLE